MFGTTNIAIAGGVLALLGLVGFVVMRKRSGEAASEFDDAPLVDEGLFDDIGPSSGSTSAGASDAFSIGAAPPEPSTPSADGQSSLFDGNASFEADTVVDEPAPSAPPPMLSASSDGGDNARITQELERRVAGIESRLDDANEHRDRLEQQVAAQTEELRVQRAAIARTQRAVRNLNRPEEEDAPTEPALRDPGRPGAPRV